MRCTLQQHALYVYNRFNDLHKLHRPAFYEHLTDCLKIIIYNMELSQARVQRLSKRSLALIKFNAIFACDDESSQYLFRGVNIYGAVFQLLLHQNAL